MVSGTLGQLVAAQDRITKIVWAAMCGALLIYGGLPFLMAAQWKQAGDAASAPLTVLAGLAVVLGVGSVIYRRREFSDEKLGFLLKQPASPEKLALQAPSDNERAVRLAELDAMSTDDLRIYSVVISRQAPAIVTLAMQEAVGILGLVAAFTAQDPTLALPFVAAALALHFGVFPNTVKLAERVQRLSLSVPVMS